MQAWTVGVKASQVAVELRWIVGQRQRLRDERDNVDPPAGDALVEPEAHGVVDLAPDCRRLPVEIRLLDRKDVQVVLARGGVERPRRSAEERSPVGRRAAVLRRPPDVVVAIRIVAGRARRDEPRMFVRTVIGDEVEHQPQTARLHLREHRVEVGHRAEVGHDVAIVGDVVSVVGVGRLEDRADPDHVDAKLFQVVEPAGDPGKVADTVTVAVLEAARINLVDDRFFPPRFRGLHTLSRALCRSGRRRLRTAGRRRKHGEAGRATGDEEGPARGGHHSPRCQGFAIPASAPSLHPAVSPNPCRPLDVDGLGARCTTRVGRGQGTGTTGRRRVSSPVAPR